MASLESENVFSRLHKYNFLEDEKFLSGWTRVRDGLATADDITLARKFLEAKVFYFSKFVEEVSLSDYMAWLEQLEESSVNEECKANSEIQDLPQEKLFSKLKIIDAADEVTVHNTDTDNKAPQSQTKDTAIEGEPSKDSSEDANDKETQDKNLSDLPHYPKTFHDILDMVEKGVPLPGVEDLNIEPTNALPTKACARRMPKPWEKDG